MPKFMRLALIFAALLIAGGVYVVYAALPAAIEGRAEDLLRSAGFANAALPAPKRSFGHITYQDIALDPDGFSTIDRLDLNYSLFGLRTIVIEAPDLTGELLSDATIRIAGRQDTPQNLLNFKALKNVHLSIKQARIALLSEEFGGINLNFDLQLRPHGREIEFQAALNGEQKQLSFKANAHGQINHEGLWQSIVEIEQGKFALGPIQAARLAGNITMNGHIGRPNTLEESRILGELQAGGMNIIGLPWQNAALTLDGNLTQIRMIIAAKATGHDGIELGLSLENLKNPTAFSGNLHAEQLGPLFDYLHSQNALPAQRGALALLDKISMIDMDFQTQNNELIFNIKNKNQAIDIKGSLDDFFAKEVHGRFTSEPIMLRQNGASETQGRVTLAGDFTYEPHQPLKGQATAKIDGAKLDYGSLQFEDLQGTLKINKLDALEAKPADFKGQLAGFTPQHTAALQLKLNGGKPVISDFKLDTAGLALRASKPTSFEITALDLQDLFKSMQLENWVGTGRLSGSFTITAPHMLKDLNLKSVESGIIKIKDPDFFDLVPGDVEERETIRQALENFHYDTLELMGQGQLPEGGEFRLIGKGNNPGLMNGQAFAIDIVLKPDLTPLTARFFKD